jgi:hypothetical protein
MIQIRLAHLFLLGSTVLVSQTRDPAFTSPQEFAKFLEDTEGALAATAENTAKWLNANKDVIPCTCRDRDNLPLSLGEVIVRFTIPLSALDSLPAGGDYRWLGNQSYDVMYAIEFKNPQKPKGKVVPAGFVVFRQVSGAWKLVEVGSEKLLEAIRTKERDSEKKPAIAHFFLLHIPSLDSNVLGAVPIVKGADQLWVVSPLQRNRYFPARDFKPLAAWLER